MIEVSEVKIASTSEPIEACDRERSNRTVSASKPIEGLSEAIVLCVQISCRGSCPQRPARVYDLCPSLRSG